MSLTLGWHHVTIFFQKMQDISSYFYVKLNKTLTIAAEIGTFAVDFDLLLCYTFYRFCGRLFLYLGSRSDSRLASSWHHRYTYDATPQKNFYAPFPLGMVRIFV